MRRYSKRVREEAALICAAAACHEPNASPYYNILAGELEIGFAPVRLAMRAWQSACEAYDGRWTREVDAEAASMLLDGWSP